MLLINMLIVIGYFRFRIFFNNKYQVKIYLYESKFKFSFFVNGDNLIYKSLRYYELLFFINCTRDRILITLKNIFLSKF